MHGNTHVRFWSGGRGGDSPADPRLPRSFTVRLAVEWRAHRLSTGSQLVGRDGSPRVRSRVAPPVDPGGAVPDSERHTLTANRPRQEELSRALVFPIFHWLQCQRDRSDEALVGYSTALLSPVFAPRLPRLQQTTGTPLIAMSGSGQSTA